MRGKTYRGKWLLAALLVLSPGLAWAQSTQLHNPTYAPADPQIPLPYGSTRPEDGGFYTFGGVLMYRQSNPLRPQLVAVRGLFAYDTGGATATQVTNQFRTVNPITGQIEFQPGDVLDTSVNVPGPPPDAGGVQVVNGIQSSVTIGAGGAIITTITGAFVINTQDVVLNGLFDQPGFVGSNQPALDVTQLTTSNPYSPGVELGIGWKFRDGSSVSLSWIYLSEVQYRAGATLAPPASFGNPPSVDIGDRLENTFLFSPVFNFPPEFAGADFKVNVDPGSGLNVNPQTVFGIWNGASIMTLEFRQRFQQWDITYREPIWETETYRLNGLVGPRYSWIWEKFKWVTTSIGQNPDGTVIEGPQFVGVYENITSNRMYGVHAGCEQEWYIGHGFAVHLRTEGALFLDSVKERAKYRTQTKYMGLPENKYAKRDWTVVPELEVRGGLMWYPTEFVQVYFGYDAMVFFNTLASTRPIDFNYSNLAPNWDHVNRVFNGWRAGIAFWF